MPAFLLWLGAACGLRVACCAQIVLSSELKVLLYNFCEKRKTKDATRPEVTGFAWDAKAKVSKLKEPDEPTPTAGAGISGSIVWNLLEFGGVLKDITSEADLKNLSVTTLRKMHAIFGSDEDSFPDPLDSSHKAEAAAILWAGMEAKLGARSA